MYLSLELLFLPDVNLSIAMGIATEQWFEKENAFKKRFEVVYFGKLWKIIKIKQVCEKPDFGSGSQLSVRKILTPYSTHSRTIPLTKYAKLM